ncbi:MAG: single-stranded DNA-binding protein [Candidatus Kerfeldbacteria bacterium]|nr:single-stranded DNA-binding protein [Candidatus Kerfeldbacteria bacterium]
MDLNRITIIGNVVRDPETKTAGKSGSLTAFTVATNRVWTDRETKTKKEAVDFHPVAAWGRLGEVAGQYLKKGSKVYVEGRLAHKTFESKTGGKQKTVEVVAENLILLTPKSAVDDQA